MDDARTQQMLDDLADIFLTVPARSAQPVRGDSPNHTPAPIRLAPKLGPAATAVLEPPAAPPQPVLAQPVLRLAGSPAEAPNREATQPPVAARRRAIMVQAVFVGNLPGFAGPWLAQYAQHLADQHHGAVAVVHLDPQQIDLEWVGGSPVAVADAATIPEVLDQLDRADGLAAVLVHLGSATVEERSLACDLDAWTILCGADDAAIVNTYRLLKQLLTDDTRPARRRVGLMIMGHGEREARFVADNLNVTAASFLRTPVQLLGWRRQMSPVQVHGSASFPAEDSPWPALNQYLRALAPKAATTAAPEGSTSAPGPALPATARMAPASPIELATLGAYAAQAPLPAPTTSRPAAVAPPLPPKDVEEPVEPRAAAAPAAPPPAPEPSEPEAAPAAGVAGVPEATPDLAVYLPGSIRLDARCPDHPATDLLLDQQGRLHLLRRATGDGDVVADPQALRSALVDLLEARRWVRRHRQLLALTQRQCRFDLAAVPVLHLFTDQGKPATALIARLGSAVKIHLLQPVRMAGQTAWACSELN